MAWWLGVLWLAGWLFLPFSRRLFPQLPDGGLAAGRLLALLLTGLLAFWGATLRVWPLSASPWLWAAISLAPTFWLLGSRSQRYDFWRWARTRSGVLAVSDLVFCLSFLVFAWLRLCRPEINEFEKPMDCAIMGVLGKAQFLPVPHPWFSGTPLTNYYTFGHLLASLLKRFFQTPLPYAYNLAQPVFCAFFLSILWSLCAALTRSATRGVLALAPVTLLGNFEPLRRLWEVTSPPAWWSTSRVIPGTINEYPFFTLALGDAHAHFFALSLATLLGCCCLEIFCDEDRPHATCAVIGGLVLGAIIMTNLWDAPLYGLLFTLCLWRAARKHRKPLLMAALFLAPFVVLPFLLRFRPPVGGLRVEFWEPDTISFLLCWSGVLLLWSLGLWRLGNASGKFHQFNLKSAHSSHALLRATALLLVLLTGAVVGGLLPLLLSLLLLAATVYFLQWCNTADRCPPRLAFIGMLAFCGLLALLLPHFLYLNGHFGGELRHQDTVFKLGLQSWLLLSTAGVCMLFQPAESGPPRLTVRRVVVTALVSALLFAVPLRCSWLVWQARSAPAASTPGVPVWSLNGSRALPLGEQQAIAWLEEHGSATDVVLENIGREANGSLSSAYSPFARVATLCGVPTPLGWPQHAAFWGANPHDLAQRAALIDVIYRGADRPTRDAALEELGVTFIFCGLLEPTDARRRFRDFPVAFRSADAIIFRRAENP